MSRRVVILGAGFGGLEASTTLSEALGDGVDVTLIDRNEGFVFGFSKLELMFGRAQLDDVRSRYADIAMPGVAFRQETVTAIDPEARRVATDAGAYDADVLVVALGADLDVAATPGLAEAGHEFYSVAGAQESAGAIEEFAGGHAVVGICGAPIKCAPAPSECVLLLDEALRARGVRDACEISFVIPMPAPVPPSKAASVAIEDEFERRGIKLVADARIASLDPERKVALLADGTELAFDLFLGVPKHRAPAVVAAAGLTGDDGFVSVDRDTLQTRFPGVYAIGDVTNAAGVPKAGVFAQLAGHAVAQSVIAEIRGAGGPGPYGGRGSCYVEFGGGLVGRVDVDTTAPPGSGAFLGPSAELAADKKQFSATRRARWFGG